MAYEGKSVKGGAEGGFQQPPPLREKVNNYKELYELRIQKSGRWPY